MHGISVTICHVSAEAISYLASRPKRGMRLATFEAAAAKVLVFELLIVIALITVAIAIMVMLAGAGWSAAEFELEVNLARIQVTSSLCAADHV